VYRRLVVENTNVGWGKVLYQAALFVGDSELQSDLGHVVVKGVSGVLAGR